MRLVVVAGVGTDVGKTHLATALVRAWSGVEPARGYKPIESGVVGDAGPDEALLAAASTFHVKHPRLQIRLRAPVSPHLAAREEGVSIRFEDIAREVQRLREDTALVVELPGGLFTPLTETTTSADLASLLCPDVLLLVAPNRIGVLHDVTAVVEACRARHLRLDGVVVSAPPLEDASSRSNPTELPRTSGLPVLASLARAQVAELVESGALGRLLAYCRGLPLEVPPL